MKIDIYTFITRNSTDYAEFLQKTAIAMSSGNHDLRWKYIKSNYVGKGPDGWTCVGSSPNLGHNSYNHAEAMQSALVNLINTEMPDIAIFIDADTAVLYPNWDEIVCKRIKDKCVCFGGDYGQAKHKYKNFPTVYMFAFNPKIAPILNFYPALVDGKESVLKSKIKTKDLANVVGLPVGSLFKQDTGWALPCIIKNAGYSGYAMPRVLCGNGGEQLPYKNGNMRDLCIQKPEHMCEWHYKGKAFFTHKQASRNHPLNESVGAIWKWRIEKYFEEKGVAL